MWSKKWHKLLFFYEKILGKLFGCEKLAVCQIGNLTRDEKGEISSDKRYEHIHWHLIPSYTQPVQFNGLEHVDLNFGRALNIDEERGYKKMPVSREHVIAIVEAVKKYERSLL